MIITYRVGQFVTVNFVRYLNNQKQILTEHEYIIWLYFAHVWISIHALQKLNQVNLSFGRLLAFVTATQEVHWQEIILLLLFWNVIRAQLICFMCKIVPASAVWSIVNHSLKVNHLDNLELPDYYPCAVDMWHNFERMTCSRTIYVWSMDQDIAWPYVFLRSQELFSTCEPISLSN